MSAVYSSASSLFRPSFMSVSSTARRAAGASSLAGLALAKARRSVTPWSVCPVASRARACQYRASGDDGGIRGARSPEAFEAIEGFGFPEAKLTRLPRGRLEALGLLECLECRLARALGESCLAQEQGRLPRPPVAREALDKALEHAAGKRVQTVVAGLLPDQEETVRLLHGGPRA